jgi:proline iminopeptidase
MPTFLIANDLELLRLHLGDRGDQKLRLIGHSDGGSIMLAYALRFPERVEELLLVSHRLQDYRRKDEDVFMERRKDNPVYDSALKALTTSEPASTDSEFVASLTAGLPYYFADPTKVDGSGLKRLLSDDISIWASQGWDLGQTEHPFPHVKELEAVRVRTLCMFGSEDAVCFVQEGVKAVEGIESARLVAYEECGHILWIEKEEEFFRDAVSFLNGES